MKIIAFYLPQFHNIPENDEWWGDGFTEWTNVKGAKPIYRGQQQPKVPLNKNYYNLLDDNVKIWQDRLEKKYGIYGFCYYHYWFNGKMLLQKPMEQMLKNSCVDIPFCICWANEPWTKAWVAEDRKVLIPQKYGERKEWKEHFEYLVPFFKDQRYIRIDDKPVIIIYRPKVISCVREMMQYWKELAVESGLNGLITMCATNDLYVGDDERYQVFDHIIEWQPHTAKKFGSANKKDGKLALLKKLRRIFYSKLERVTGIDIYKYDPIALRQLNRNNFWDYGEVWEKVIKMSPLDPKSIPGAFVRWDNTPRYREKATVIKGETPEKFKTYLKKQIIHAKNAYQSDMIFMYAWNEWAEGGFLEPDEQNGYAYLRALKDALEETGELED